jgi:hypothetical protein
MGKSSKYLMKIPLSSWCPVFPHRIGVLGQSLPQLSLSVSENGAKKAPNCSHLMWKMMMNHQLFK